MNRLRETLNVLMTHGYIWQAAFDAAGFLTLLALTIVLRSEVCLLLAGIFLLFLVWETDEAGRNSCGSLATRATRWCCWKGKSVRWKRRSVSTRR